MSGQNNPNENQQNQCQDQQQNTSHPGAQDTSQPASSSSSLFNPNYRGPQSAGQHGQQLYNTNASRGIYGRPAQSFNSRAYNHGQGRGYHPSHFGQAHNPVASRGRGYPSGQGGFQGRGAPGGRFPPYTGPSNPYPPFGAGYPPQGYHHHHQDQQPFHPPPAQQHPGRGTGHFGPARFPSAAPGRTAGQRGHRAPAPPPNRLPPTGFQPVQPHGRAASPNPPPKPFGDDDFPSLGKAQSRQHTPRQQPSIEANLAGQRSQAAEGQHKPAASRGGRGGHRGKFVAFTDFNISGSSGPSSQQPAAATLPPPRKRRNNAFRLGLGECYRGKIVFIDELAGLDYSAHPAVVRSVDPMTGQIKFYKKSSFKSIGGFLNKYGEYVNQAQKRWHEKQWLLVDDGTTQPHHGTPLLTLAHGEMMPEKGSYVDIHGDTELHLDYFSKYSRYGIFPDIYLPEDQMARLEAYSKWYLDKDAEYRTEEEKRKREKWQMDGSADVDIGKIYEDSENEED